MTDTSPTRTTVETSDSNQSSTSILLIGWTATIASVSMYFAYIDPISLNLNGTKGSVIQPAATFLAASLWVAYAALRPKRDWPLICANVPGILLAAAAAMTAL